ncbi:unnamed protein product [Darwinula stevensoni]|uniref:Uncharacterized protein n=1 Tax=Darwinula stevensoni TaxID=69355 RepID=A0A7R8X3I9_9CRUS|nr:unnamed protein product [Darwinula stevensoni]CAG0884437.1 unnamed protein product [Darwinula stevensoni]
MMILLEDASQQTVDKVKVILRRMGRGDILRKAQETLERNTLEAIITLRNDFNIKDNTFQSAVERSNGVPLHRIEREKVRNSDFQGKSLH